MNKKFRIAIIGFGKRGKTHLRSYSKIKNVEVVAICDVNKDIVFNRSIKYYQDFKQMVKLEKLDAVSICVPNNRHYLVTSYCLKNKINVLCEKPLSFNINQAKKLIIIAKKNNLVLQIGYHLRFDNLIKKIKSIINSKELGKILMVKARQSHDWGGLRPFRWFLNQAISGGGTIIDNATHYLDLFEYLFGNIKELSAFSNNLSFRSKVEDNAIITMKFKSNILGEIETSWKDPSGRNNQLVIFGSRAIAEYRETNLDKTLEIKRYVRDEDEWNRLVRENIYLPKGIEQVSKLNNIDNKKDLLLENTESMLNYFIDSIKKPKLNTFNDLTRTILLVNAVYKSVTEKIVVKID